MLIQKVQPPRCDDGPVTGSLLCGKYRILGLLGQGGQSRVYLALHEPSGIRRAIKILRPDTGDSCLAQRSVLTEAEILRSLSCPCFPTLIDLLETTKNMPPMIVMDYIEGTPLSVYLKEHGPQSCHQVISWGLRLCEILHDLHTQSPPVIYRDLKPANVILRPDGDLALVDFGSARRYRTASSPLTGRDPHHPADDTIPLGTRGYAAPEQFGGHGQSDARTDIYGLGATLYHLLTGCHPARDAGASSSPLFSNVRVPDGLRTIIDRCVQSDPSKRYRDCMELRTALLHCRKQTRLVRIRTMVLRAAACAALSLPAIGMGILARTHIAGAKELSVTAEVGLPASDDPPNNSLSAGFNVHTTDIAEDDISFYTDLSRRIKKNREQMLNAGVSEEELNAILSYLEKQLKE
ncbi:MAG: serine/threonine protein kinase [Lachnospiraceae bacterium]|nr:serine/threonine protein kinase [Lachnospiraceae bacterium]